MTARDLLLSKRLPGNTLDQGAAVQRALSELANREVEVPQLSGIATDFGLINAGTIVMGNGQPLGAGFTGVMRFADPLEWPAGSGTYWTEIGFQTDIMMYGISAADGSVYAAGGLLALYNKGISLTGPVGLVNFQSINAFRVYSGGLGFALVNGASSSTPYLSLTNDSSLTGSNLIANGDFETGTLANWTVTTTPPAAATVIAGISIFSKYALVLSKPTNGAVATVTSDRVTSGVTGEKGYIVSFIAVKNATQGQVLINWYDSTSGGALLRTDTMPVNLLIPGSGIGQRGWGQHIFHTLSPAGALSFEVVCQAPAGGSAPFGSVYIDNVTVHASSVLEMLVLREGGARYSHNGVETGFAPQVVGYGTYNTDAAEHTIATFTIKGGAQGPAGGARLSAQGRIFNTMGASKTYVVRVYINTTLVHDSTALAVSNNASAGYDLNVFMTNVNDETSQLVTCDILRTNAATGTATTGAETRGNVTPTSEDTTIDTTITVTMQLSASAATLTHYLRGASLLVGG